MIYLLSLLLQCLDRFYLLLLLLCLLLVVAVALLLAVVVIVVVIVVVVVVVVVRILCNCILLMASMSGCIYDNKTQHLNLIQIRCS